MPPPPPAPQLIKLAGRREIQQTIFHPLRRAARGVFPHWQLPTFLTTEQGAQIALDDLQSRFEIDWQTVGGFTSAVLQNLQLQSWTVRFYMDEPDPSPNKFQDRPRLDALLEFKNGAWVRWHPSGMPIWSTERLPTAAMITRRNRHRKLLVQLQKLQAQR